MLPLIKQKTPTWAGMTRCWWAEPWLRTVDWSTASTTPRLHLRRTVPTVYIQPTRLLKQIVFFRNSGISQRNRSLAEVSQNFRSILSAEWEFCKINYCGICWTQSTHRRCSYRSIIQDRRRYALLLPFYRLSKYVFCHLEPLKFSQAKRTDFFPRKMVKTEALKLFDTSPRNCHPSSRYYDGTPGRI